MTEGQAVSRAASGTSRRVSTLDGFVGQPRAVRFIGRIVNGAMAREQPAPPISLIGPSGSGKSALAEALARAVKSKCIRLMAGRDVTARLLVESMAQLEHFDLLFVDEAHALPPSAQEILFQAIDERIVPSLSGRGLDLLNGQSIARFWLVLATNQPGQILKALRTRCIEIQLDPYRVKDLTEIAKRAATATGVEITPQAARRLAEVAQGLPRNVEKRLTALTLLYDVDRLTQQEVDEYLREEGIDANGLSPKQREYLHILASASGPCPLTQLRVRLGCDAAYLREEVEDYLARSGWIDIGPRGRQLTAPGRGIARGVETPALDLAEEEDVSCKP